jgi:hypothetical protein
MSHMISKRLCVGAIGSFTTEATLYWGDRFLYCRRDCVLGQSIPLLPKRLCIGTIDSFTTEKIVLGRSIPLLQKRLCTWTIDSFTTEEIVYWGYRFLYSRSDCVLGQSIPLLQKRLLTRMATKACSCSSAICTPSLYMLLGFCFFSQIASDFQFDVGIFFFYFGSRNIPKSSQNPQKTTKRSR